MIIFSFIKGIEDIYRERYRETRSGEKTIDFLSFYKPCPNKIDYGACKW